MVMAKIDFHKKALERMDAGDFAGAERLLSDARKVPGRLPVWLIDNDLALCRFAQGDTTSAMTILAQVLVAEPKNSFASINRFYMEAADKVRRSPEPEPQKKVEEVRGTGPEQPAVTVVMPTYNRAELIAESIRSVQAQTLTDWELVIVNDGGSREVEATVEPFLADPRIRYAYAKHGGLSSARNVGMALARGDYICQLDDDDIYYPEHLETLHNFLRNNSGCAAAYTDVHRAFQEKRDGRWETVKKTVPYSIDFDLRLMRHQSYVPVISLMHARDCIRRAGWYNEHILRAMDWEYFIRLGRVHPLHHLRAVTCEQRERNDRSQMTRTFEVPRNYYRNLVSYLHGFFPLTGARFLPGKQGSGERLKKALDRLIGRDPDDFFLQRLELRKLLTEPYYALFYTLGKRLTDEGLPKQAQAAFRAAAKVRPFELRIWLRVLGGG